MDVKSIFGNRESISITKRGSLPDVKYTPPSFEDIIFSLEKQGYKLLFSIDAKKDLDYPHDDTIYFLKYRNYFHFLSQLQCPLRKNYKSTASFQMAYNGIIDSMIAYRSLSELIKTNYGFYPFGPSMVSAVEKKIGETISL